MNPLGRRTPTDWEHVEKYALKLSAESIPEYVKKTLRLPWWHWTHDQGSEGSCVGHGVAMERAISNIAQAKLSLVLPYGRRYNPLHVWNEAKEIDEWPDTNPGDDNGTSVRAGYEVARAQGLCRVRYMKLEEGVPVPYGEKPASSVEGVESYRWATTVDEMRACINRGIPVTIGVNWYSAFDRPSLKSDGYYLPSESLGSIRGGHCVTVYGADDDRECVKFKNSWGRDYPLVFLPYPTMARLLREDGEAALVVDR